MKRVDMSGVEVVHSGEPWEFPAPPCSRQMIRHLEMNEGLFTWVQARLAFFACGVGLGLVTWVQARFVFLLVVFGAQG
jgi:hypothetical protein